MLHSILKIWALFFGISLIMLGIGLQGTLLGLRATLEGFGATTIGAVMSSYFVGFICGSWATPRLVRRVGHIRVFAALASLTSTTVLLHALQVEPVSWAALRFVTGMSMAGLYVICESWLNHGTSNETRGRILSIYTIISYAFFGIGQLMLNLGDPAGFTLFILISVLMSLSMVPISLTPHAAPPIDQPRYVGLGELYHASPLGFLGCLVTGLAQGAFFGLAAVYATLNGLNVAATALFMALPIFGVVVLQLPIGWLSDRLDRRTVIMGISLVVGVIALINLLAPGLPLGMQIAMVTAFGALSFPLYSLCIAHMNDHIEADQMLDASGKLVLLYGVGSAIGPILAGALIDGVGIRGFFLLLGAVHLALGGFAVWRMLRSESLPLDAQGNFVLVSPRMTTVAAGVAMELSEEGSSAEGPEIDTGTEQPRP